MDMKKTLRALYFKYIRLFHGVDKNKVLFESFGGKTYSDNPRAISEALARLCPETEIVWLFTDPESKKGILPEGVRTVNITDTKKYYRELATAGAFVTNFVLPDINKSKKQMFIQAWHGDRAFKKILLDATRTYVPEQNEGYCDLALAGSDYGEMQYRSAFHYTGEILREGTPRDDRLVHPDASEIKALRAKLGISEDTKILLYAPTLRDKARDAHVKQEMQDIDIEATIASLERKYGCPWLCLVRAHPGVLGLNVSDSDKKRNVSSYEDMGDLLLIADMLITDYSSSAGDFALLNRPLVLFQSDRQDYIENSRALYFDIRTCPYFVAETQDELEALIDNFTDDGVRANCEAVLNFYNTTESGHTAEAVAKRILLMSIFL
ncbi:MAG: hypothetical protein E7657_07920 [Ruminococcaceae bacterium]|nr:hypothetical protein [Oscillospiraceae bacterium]